MGKNPLVQLCGCHDLHTADREFVLTRTVISCVVYSDKKVSLHKGNHQLSKHAFIEIVKITKVHNWT